MPGAPQGSQHPKCVPRSPQPPLRVWRCGLQAEAAPGICRSPTPSLPGQPRPARAAAGGMRAPVSHGRCSQGSSSRGLGTLHPGPGDTRAPNATCGGCRGRCALLSQRKHFGEASLAGEAARRAECSLCKVPCPPHASRPPRRIPGVPVRRGLGLCPSWGERGCLGAALVPQARAQSQRPAPQILIANQLLISAMSDAGIAAHEPRGRINTALPFPARSLPAEPGYPGIRGCSGHRQQPRGLPRDPPVRWVTGTVARWPSDTSEAGAPAFAPPLLSAFSGVRVTHGRPVRVPGLVAILSASRRPGWAGRGR